MRDLIPTPSQTTWLAFHIVFACLGVAMPLLMAIAEWRYLKACDEVYYRLSGSWALGAAFINA